MIPVTPCAPGPRHRAAPSALQRVGDGDGVGEDVGVGDGFRVGLGFGVGAIVDFAVDLAKTSTRCEASSSLS